MNTGNEEKSGEREHVDRAESTAWNVPRALCIAALLATVFCVVVHFSMRHNDYPVYFHPNSGPQAKELITGHHNFHQPLLLVTLAKAAVMVTGTPPTSQAVGEIGNMTAAALGGLAAAALTLLAFLLRGWLGAICAAVMLALCSPLIYYGHFFKEDTALAFGIAATFLALGWFWPRRTLWSIALVGAACGLAVAGKYIGFAATALALPVVLLARPVMPLPLARPGSSRADGATQTISRGRAAGWFLIAMLVSFFAVNYEALFPLKHFIEGVSYEVFHVTSGESDHGYIDLKRTKSLAQYAGFFEAEMPWTVTAMAAIGSILILARWRASSAVEKLMVLFAAAFFLVVTQSTVQQSRHMLPTWMLWHAIAAFGVVHLVSLVSCAFRASRKPLGRAAPWLLCNLLLASTGYVQWRHISHRLSEFPRDSRLLMAQWIDANLPVNSKIAADTTCGLPDPEAEFHEDESRTLDVEVVTSKYAADLGTIDELLAGGFTHVAVSRKRINQVSSDLRVPLPAERDRHERRNEFYRLVQARGWLVWDSHGPGSIAPKRGFSGEEILLFEIAEPAAQDDLLTDAAHGPDRPSILNETGK